MERESKKLEFLKREEIRTMEKDIRKLREIEAKRERERMAALEKAEKIEPKKPAELPLEKIILPKPPKRPSLIKKLFIRLLISLLFLSLIAFLSWNFWLKEKPKPEEKIPSPKEEKPEIFVPPAFVPVKKVFDLEITKNEEIPAIFNQVLKEEIPQGELAQVVFKNQAENRLPSLKELSAAFQIEIPEEIFPKLKETYTLAIYSQKEGNRIILIAELKEKEGFSQLLNNWERKIEEEGLFILGEKIQTFWPRFKTSSYQEIDFRYLTISKEDLGICYLSFNNYFLLGTSFESIKKTIEELKALQPLTLEDKVGQLFIVGFDGRTLNAQLENFFRKYKPGGVLLLSKNIENREQLKKLISDLQNLSLKVTGLPLFVAVDQEGEPMSRVWFLEEKTAQSKIENSETAYQIGLRRGEELKKLGVNLNLAPVLDAMVEGDFYFERTFQKPAEISGQLAKSLISGQREAGILVTMKHFPGYRGIKFNPEEKLAILEKVPLISQFKIAKEAGPELVMTANVIYKEIDPSLPFSFSAQAIQFLKDNLGSDILIVSDDLDRSSLLENFTLKEIFTKSIEAGIDILIFSGYHLPAEKGLDEFLATVKNREISEELINKAISRITELKKKLLK